MKERVGQIVKRLRSDEGLSLDDLAARTGVDRGTLNRIELGKQRPHRATLASIAQALSVSPEVFGIRPRPMESARESSGVGGSGGGVGIEDRLGELLAYIKTLEGPAREDFINAATALLNALKHARPAASTGTAPDDER